MTKLYRFEGKEPVLRWPGVLAAVLVYPLYIWVLPRIVQEVMVMRYLALNPQADTQALVEYMDGSLLSLNLIVYAITTLVLIIIFGRFILASAKEFFRNMDYSLWYVPITGAVMTYTGNVLATLITASITGGTQSANNETAVSLITGNPMAMFVMSALLAPFCEEIIFRAALFRPLYFKSKVAAVAITVLLFGLHHVWQAAITGDWMELVYIIQYIPSSAALVFCYCMFNNCFGAILMHTLLNTVSILLLTFGNLLAQNM